MGLAPVVRFYVGVNCKLAGVLISRFCDVEVVTPGVAHEGRLRAWCGRGWLRAGTLRLVSETGCLMCFLLAWVGA